MASAEQVGERVRALRVQRGLSQEQVAGPGVSASYVSLIESGRRRPSPDALQALAVALGTSAEFLAQGEGAALRRQEELDLRLAEVALRSGDAAGAERRFRELHDAASSPAVRAAAQHGIAEALEAQGHLEQAIEVYEAIRTRANDAGDTSWLTA